MVRVCHADDDACRHGQQHACGGQLTACAAAVLTTLNILVIAYIILAGLPRGHVSYLSDFAPYGLRGIFHASSVVFFSFVGFDAVATAAEEVCCPSKPPLGLTPCCSRDLPVAEVTYVCVHTRCIYSSLLECCTWPTAAICHVTASRHPVRQLKCSPPDLQASNPGRDLPLAILGGLALCTVLYLGALHAACDHSKSAKSRDSLPEQRQH